MVRVFALLMLLSLPSLAQTSASHSRISKLVLESGKSHHFIQGDSSITLTIDTLIMKDRSVLIFPAKKKVNLIVNYARVGKNCVMAGTDHKNNGTNLNLYMNFMELGSLFIDVEGQDTRWSNRAYANGNGGQVNLNYLASGRKPQIDSKKRPNYVSVSNKGGGYTVNPPNDIAVILGQIRFGSMRPLGAFPNSMIYSGTIGNDGKTNIRPLDKLP